MPYYDEEEEVRNLLNRAYPPVHVPREMQERAWNAVLQGASMVGEPGVLILGYKPVYWAVGIGVLALILIIAGISAGLLI